MSQILKFLDSTKTQNVNFLRKKDDKKQETHIFEIRKPFKSYIKQRKVFCGQMINSRINQYKERNYQSYYNVKPVFLMCDVNVYRHYDYYRWLQVRQKMIAFISEHFFISLLQLKFFSIKTLHYSVQTENLQLTKN